MIVNFTVSDASFRQDHHYLDFSNGVMSKIADTTRNWSLFSCTIQSNESIFDELMYF